MIPFELRKVLNYPSFQCSYPMKRYETHQFDLMSGQIGILQFWLFFAQTFFNLSEKMREFTRNLIWKNLTKS